MLVGDNADLLVKPWHMSRDRSNRHLHVFHMIAVKKRIPIPEDLIHIRIPQIKNIVNEVNLQDFIPCGQDKARLRFETEILVLRDLLKLIDELKWPYLDLLNSLYVLIIDWLQLLHSNILSLTQTTKERAAYSMVYLTTLSPYVLLVFPGNNGRKRSIHGWNYFNNVRTKHVRPGLRKWSSSLGFLCRWFA